MKTILWHQGKTIGAKDVIVIDGSVNEYEGSPIQDEAFQKLISGREWHQYNSVPTLRKYDNSISPQLHVFFNSSTNEAMIQTHFVDRDEKDRRIPVMFYISVSGTSEDVMNILKENVCAIGMTLSSGDVKVVKRALDFFLKKKCRIRMAIVTATIITISIILVCSAGR